MKVELTPPQIALVSALRVAGQVLKLPRGDAPPLLSRANGMCSRVPHRTVLTLLRYGVLQETGQQDRHGNTVLTLDEARLRQIAPGVAN